MLVWTHPELLLHPLSDAHLSSVFLSLLIEKVSHDSHSSYVLLAAAFV